MFKKRRLAAWLLTIVLTLGMFSAPPVSAAPLYFTSVNDHLSALTTDTMPLWSGGILYVPYTVFQSSTNGGNDFGLVCSHNRNTNVFSIFNLVQILSFNLETNECIEEISGQQVAAKAIMRNNIVYLPLVKICNYFDLEYTYTSIPYVSQGYLVRIKDSQVVLTDPVFLDAASGLINRRLREYNQSLAAQTTPTPPTPPPAQTTPTPPPAVTPHPEAPTYLAFRCDTSSGINRILTTLKHSDTYAVFFMTPELLEQDRDLVRKIAGSGHSIGIWASGSDEEETMQLLSDGSQLLAGLLHSRSTLALVPKRQHSAVEGAGWVCWNGTLTLSPSSSVSTSAFASDVLSDLSDHTGSLYLTMDGNSNSARVLTSLLTRLSDENFIFSIPMETEL